MDLEDWCPKFLVKNPNDYESNQVNEYKQEKSINIREVFASPIWKYHPNKLYDIRWCLSQSKTSLTLTTLNEEDMTTRQAKWVHYLFARHNHVDISLNRQGELYFLYVDTGVNFTQFTVLDNMGNNERVMRINIGYTPEKNQLISEIFETLYEEFGRQIEYIVMYGSIYDLFDGTVPTISSKFNKFLLESYGIDYSHLGFVSSQFYTSKMIFIHLDNLKKEDIKLPLPFEYNFQSIHKDNNYYMILNDTSIEIFNSNSHKCYAIHPYSPDWIYSKEGFQKILESLKSYFDCTLHTIPI
jgi:hypothetical protein